MTVVSSPPFGPIVLPSPSGGTVESSGASAPPATCGSFGNELYARLSPLAYADAENGYALRTLCCAIGAMFQPVDDLARDTPLGPGWSQLLDVDIAPANALPWLGQFVGVKVNPSFTDTQKRAQIQAETGMARGTVAAIRAAAQNLLTGSQTVIILERSPDAYSFTVLTYTNETPDSDAVQAALTAAKPAGLNLTYETVAGQIWAELIANYSTWADVISAFATWQDVINNTP